MWELEIRKRDQINNFILQNGKLKAKEISREITESINTRLSSRDWAFGNQSQLVQHMIIIFVSIR